MVATRNSLRQSYGRYNDPDGRSRSGRVLHNLDVTVQQVIALVDAAKIYYQQACEKTGKAGKSNANAQWAGAIGMATNGGWGWGGHHRCDDWNYGYNYHAGANVFTGMNQHERAKKMKAAMRLGQQGSAELKRAFGMIPAGCQLRREYGNLMVGVGDIYVPDLKGDKFSHAMMGNFFGGTWGAMANTWDKGSDIEQNAQILYRAMQVCEEQKAKLTAVLNEIQKDMAAPRSHAPAAPYAPATPYATAGIPVTATMPHVPTSAGANKFCMFCGKQIAAAAAFCGHCGEKQPEM